VSVGGLSRHKKTAVSICHHCSLPLKRPVKHFESDGSKRRAGDGARTRDSLLGRQSVTKTPLVYCEMALEERLYIFTVIHAHLRQIVTCILRQMIMGHMHWKEYTRHLLERQERQMVNPQESGTRLSPCSLKCPEHLSHGSGKSARAREWRYLRWRRAGSVKAV
jgi:hypothetical protein